MSTDREDFFEADEDIFWGDFSWAYSWGKLECPTHSSNVAASLQRVFENHEANDLLILCGGKKIGVHRAVVCFRSEKLQAACDGPIIISTNTDNVCSAITRHWSEQLMLTVPLATGIVRLRHRLKHEDLLTVEVMIWFLYFGNYPYFDEDGTDGIFDGPRFSIHVKVYSLATRFNIPALRQLAKKHFREALKRLFDHDRFLHCIPIVYESEANIDNLRDMILRQIHKLSLIEIMSHSHYRTCYLTLFQKYPQFAADVLAVTYSPPCAKQLAPRPAASKVRKPDKGSTRFDGIWTVAERDPVAYDATLLLTRPRGQKNKFCRLQVLEGPYAPQCRSRCYITWTRSGPVGEVGKILRICNCDPEAAVKAFTLRFTQKSGLEWEDRFEIPLKSRYTFVRDNFDGLDNSAAKPLLFDVSKTSTSIRLHNENLHDRAENMAPPSQQKTRTKKPVPENPPASTATSACPTEGRARLLTKEERWATKRARAEERKEARITMSGES